MVGDIGFAQRMDIREFKGEAMAKKNGKTNGNGKKTKTETKPPENLDNQEHGQEADHVSAEPIKKDPPEESPPEEPEIPEEEKDQITLPEKDLFRIDEVANYFQVEERTIRLWIQHGHLRKENIVGVMRISRTSILSCRFPGKKSI